MSIKAEFIYGKNHKNEWAGVHGFKPEDFNAKKLGELYSVIRLSTENASESSLERIAGLIIDELQNEYYTESTEVDLLVRLEDSLLKMKSHMDNIITREESIVKNGMDFEMALAIVAENVLYAAVIGESKIIIKREEKLVDITKGLIDTSMAGFVKTGSLVLQDTDKIALVTSKGFDSNDTLIDIALDKLDPDVLAHDFSSKQGAAVLILADKDLDWFVRETLEADEIQEEDNNLDAPLNEELELNDAKEDEIHANVEEGELDLDNQESKFANVKIQLQDKLNIFKTKSAGIFANVKARFNRDNNVDDIEDAQEGDEENLETPQNSEDKPQSFSQIQDEYMDDEDEKDGPDYKALALGTANKAKDLGTKVTTGVRNHFKNNRRTYAHILRNIFDAVQKVTVTAKDFFQQNILGTNDRRSYLKRNKIKRNRIIFAVVMVLLLFFIYTGYKNQKEKSARKNFETEVKQRVDSYSSTLQNLSVQVDSAKTQGEDKKTLIISELNSLNTKAEQEKANKLYTTELSNIQSEITKQKDELLLVSAVSQPEVVVDFGKLFKDAVLSDIAYVNGNIYVSDSARNVIYKSSTNLNSTPEVQVSNLSSPQVLVPNAAGEIIFYDNNAASNIGKFSTASTGQEPYRYPLLSATNIGKIAEASTYSGNDALYELHQNHQQIFKRNRQGNDYEGGGANYLTANPPNWKTDPEFTNAIDISTPFEAYVLIQNKGLRRYLGGAENTLTFGVFKNFIKADFDSFNTASAIDVTQKYMAVADSKNKRVMVFEIEDNDAKNLIFTKQFVYRGSDNTFSQINEVVINETSRQIYVLDGSKVVRLTF